MPRKLTDLTHRRLRADSPTLDVGRPRRPTGLDRIMNGAGNAAVAQLLQGEADIEVQRELGLFPPSVTAPRDQAKTLDQIRPEILAWLEPQREELENRARSTSMGIADPAHALTMGVKDGVTPSASSGASVDVVQAA